MSLKTTVGGAYADSFCTLEEASATITGSGLNASNLAHWTALSTGAKELRLKLSAHFIGTLPLRGKRVYKYQALAFPRNSQLDVTKIPTAVKEAQALLAYLLVDPNISLTDPSQSPSEAVLLDEALVRSVEVVGIMKVGLQNTVEAATLKAQAALESYLYKAMRAYGGFIWLLLKPYISQIRGGNIDKLVADSADLLTSPDYT